MCNKTYDPPDGRSKGVLMSNKKKNRQSLPEKPARKPINYKKIFALIGAIILSTVIYFGLTELSVRLSENAGRQIYIPVMEIYTIVVALLVCAIVIINAGMQRGVDPTELDLPDSWSAERKEAFLRSVPKRRKAVKVLSFIMIAVIFPLFCEIASWWFEAVKKGFSS